MLWFRDLDAVYRVHCHIYPGVYIYNALAAVGTETAHLQEYAKRIPGDLERPAFCSGPLHLNRHWEALDASPHPNGPTRVSPTGPSTNWGPQESAFPILFVFSTSPCLVWLFCGKST